MGVAATGPLDQRTLPAYLLARTCYCRHHAAVRSPLPRRRLSRLPPPLQRRRLTARRVPVDSVLEELGVGREVELALQTLPMRLDGFDGQAQPVRRFPRGLA